MVNHGNWLENATCSITVIQRPHKVGKNKCKNKIIHLPSFIQSGEELIQSVGINAKC